MASDADPEAHQMHSTVVLLFGTLWRAFAVTRRRGKCDVVRKLVPDRAHSQVEPCCPPIYTGTREK